MIIYLLKLCDLDLSQTEPKINSSRILILTNYLVSVSFCHGAIKLDIFILFTTLELVVFSCHVETVYIVNHTSQTYQHVKYNCSVIHCSQDNEREPFFLFFKGDACGLDLLPSQHKINRDHVLTNTNQHVNCESFSNK